LGDKTQLMFRKPLLPKVLTLLLHVKQGRAL
jgi:hypothetical protein